ncbi:MAG: cytochrome c oxidase assembly protein subunit Cox15 [Rhodobacteraceae bacterium HLUCCA08]|nr:MAG: cytochrome c oxidase assembly protein subunit Cox15 [Rhodobacteraceae bacterium HLUCCA08]
MATKPRSIFEEVDSARKPATAPGGIDRGGRGGARRAIRAWLVVLFALVWIMIIVGGLTRLTDSGLSITEWAPLSGAIPPVSAEAWQAEFDAYRAIPEYELQNAGMSLAEFKRIFWWEWGHRQLGRVIGLVWGAGYLWFALRRQIPAGWHIRLAIPGLLGGVQAAIGWGMVHSGLQEGRVDVASYWLALHLGTAFVILGLIAWYAFALSRKEAALMQARRQGEGKLFSLTTGLMHFAFLQIVLGALVAGIDAGRAFPTWPLMGDGFLPPEPFGITPWFVNFWENAGLVQFLHRMSGYLLLAFGVVVWLRGRRVANRRTAFAVNAALAALLVQIVLGIVTVLYSAQWHVAITHQGVAVLLWVLILRARFLARYPLPQSVRDT